MRHTGDAAVGPGHAGVRRDKAVDETQELLKAVLSRLEELTAKVDGMDRRLDGMDRRLDEANQRLGNIEQRLEYYGDKWMEHDHEIWRLKRKQA